MLTCMDSYGLQNICIIWSNIKSNKLENVSLARCIALIGKGKNDTKMGVRLNLSPLFCHFNGNVCYKRSQ